MFYVISDSDQIIESFQSRPDEATLEELANECHLHGLWVIKGEHSGITWTRAEPQHKERLVFGQPLPGWAR